MYSTLNGVSNLKELKIDGYAVGDKQFAMLCLSLTNNTTLQSLCFRRSDISYDGYLALRDLLRANSTLSYFDFPYSSSVLKDPRAFKLLVEIQSILSQRNGAPRALSPFKFDLDWPTPPSSDSSPSDASTSSKISIDIPSQQSDNSFETFSPSSVDSNTIFTPRVSRPVANRHLDQMEADNGEEKKKKKRTKSPRSPKKSPKEGAASSPPRGWAIPTSRAASRSDIRPTGGSPNTFTMGSQRASTLNASSSPPAGGTSSSKKSHRRRASFQIIPAVALSKARGSGSREKGDEDAENVSESESDADVGVEADAKTEAEAEVKAEAEVEAEAEESSTSLESE
eukprot:TRINITY_DN489_c0_g1_i1.p1 TRINITY_DN489_c0_g1~~TRINITY_DN489_c0_g1_i1.p1  ORF type:complete len:371 (-),score=107.87 TRINITY_DN489_c0_g1_i1:268-1287(-)